MIEKEVLRELIKGSTYQKLIQDDETLEQIINEGALMESIPCLYLYMREHQGTPEFSENTGGYTRAYEAFLKEQERDFYKMYLEKKLPAKYYFYNWRETDLILCIKKALKAISLYKDKEFEEEKVTSALSFLPIKVVKKIYEQTECDIIAINVANSLMGEDNKEDKKKGDRLCGMLSYYIDGRAEKPQSEPFPKVLNTSKAEAIFKAAIKAGLMEKAPNREGYKWNKSKALLAYLIEKLCRGDPFPNKEACSLFNREDLKQADYALSNNINGNGKPKSFEIIDDLFK